MSAHAGRQQGVTLVELMIVTIVVAILAAVAIPSYRQHAIKVKRSEAKVELTKMAQLLERCYTRFNAYNNAGCTTGLPLTSESGSYVISGVLAAGTYTLTATPQGGQASDSQCGNYTLNQTGTKGVSGSLAANYCW